MIEFGCISYDVCSFKNNMKITNRLLIIKKIKKINLKVISEKMFFTTLDYYCCP